MFQKISLRTKAIILAIALGTLPVIGCGTAAYYLIDKNIVNSTINFQQLRANSLSDKVNRFLFERYGDIQVIANLPVLNNLKGTEKMTFQEKQNILNKYVQIYGVYDSIAAFDLKGNLILQSSSKLFSNHKDQDYFQQVLQTGLPIITNPEISKSTGEIVIYFAAPVKDVVTGKMIGVVCSRMPIKFLEAVAAEFTADQSEWHLIDNSSGKIFAAQEERQVGRNANLDFPVFAQMAAAKKMNTTIAVEQYDQAEQVLTYVPFEKLEGLPQLNWSLMFAQDTGKAFATQKQVLWTLILGTGVTALVGSGLAVMLVSRTTKLIQEIASAIASSATEIATTVEQQERTVRQQAGSVHETTTTMDELAASSQQSAAQAEASAAGTRQALAVAEAGNQAVQHALDEMSLLKVSVGAIAEQILHLSEQTTQIGSISAVVGDLANQTNMLALNAAVEAARAGENGKGFGVVAGEIRKLADQSKKSAEKINALVTDIQSSINTTIIVTDEGTKKVDQGIELAQGTAVTFTEMADSINNVFLNSQQISLSAKQQAIAVQQVVEAMNAINSGARENASGITQVKASTQQLNQVAHKLQTVV